MLHTNTCNRRRWLSLISSTLQTVTLYVFAQIHGARRVGLRMLVERSADRRECNHACIFFRFLTTSHVTIQIGFCLNWWIFWNLKSACAAYRIRLRPVNGEFMLQCHEWTPQHMWGRLLNIDVWLDLRIRIYESSWSSWRMQWGVSMYHCSRGCWICLFARSKFPQVSSGWGW